MIAKIAGVRRAKGQNVLTLRSIGRIKGISKIDFSYSITDRMMEEILGRLSKTEASELISMSTDIHYSSKNKKIRKIRFAFELDGEVIGADSNIEGTVSEVRLELETYELCVRGRYEEFRVRISKEELKRITETIYGEHLWRVFGATIKYYEGHQKAYILMELVS